MAVLALLVLATAATAMKTHLLANETFNVTQKNAHMSCAEMRRLTVNNMKDDLERSNGFDAVFYRGCLKFVERNGDKKRCAAAQTEALAEVCKKGMFDGRNSVLSKVDPSRLAAECDRATNQMDIQLRILGEDALKTNEDFCAVFVDLVLPIDEEPECMRFVEDVTHEHQSYAGTMHHWPRIIMQKHFDEAFMRVCLEDKKLEAEEKGGEVLFGAGVDECRLTLERVLATNWTHYKKLSDFFAVACPVMGLPLPEPSKKNFDPMSSTKRAMQAHMFQRASHLALAKHGNDSAQLFQRKRREPLNAIQLMHELDDLDGSVTSKSPRRRRLTTDQKTCCSGKAYNWEVGVSAGSTVVMGASVSLAAGGFDKWNGNTCYFKRANMMEVCVGWDVGLDMDGPFEVDASVARGWFKSYSDMLGDSTYVGANACFILCVGGSVIQAMNGHVIGGTVEFGFGFPGVDFEGGVCTCHAVGGEYSKTFWHLKPDCPSGCFPEDATVDTPQGRKTMQELQVGDRVLAISPTGEAFFDEVYFFGHADHKALSPMVQLRIQEFGSNASFGLELSPDHFIHICPKLQPCTWSEAETVYAAAVPEQAYVWTAEKSLKSGKVLSSSVVPKRGLFNPYTLSGNIVVNGVAASAHSSWILDPLVPEHLAKHLPSIYQSVFAGGRFIYKLFGVQAADWIGVNNPQPATPQLVHAAYATACSFMAVAPFLMAATWLVYKMRGKATAVKVD